MSLIQPREKQLAERDALNARLTATTKQNAYLAELGRGLCRIVLDYREHEQGNPITRRRMKREMYEAAECFREAMGENN